MLIVSLISGVALFFSFGDWPSLLLFGLSALLAIISIFAFKNRQNQFVLNRFNILSNLILLGVFSWRTLQSSGENSFSEKGVQLVVPFISIVFLFLANRAIRRDEELVKSADRLRQYQVTLCVLSYTPCVGQFFCACSKKRLPQKRQSFSNLCLTENYILV